MLSASFCYEAAYNRVAFALESGGNERAFRRLSRAGGHGQCGSDRELFDYSNYDTWQSMGWKALKARIHDKVLDMIEHYDPPPIPEKMERELEKIVSRADEADKAEGATRSAAGA